MVLKLFGMRRMLAFLAVLVFVPSIAHAAEEEGREAEDDPNIDVRPVRYASVEVNPLSAAVSRYGGQAQVAIMGPLTVVGAVSRIEDATVQGWAVEVGSRLFFGLAPRRADGSRIAHVFLAASYLADDLRSNDMHGERRGIALDVGVTARLTHGFYVLGGVGVAHRNANIPIGDRFEQMTTTPRLLLALGWGL